MEIIKELEGTKDQNFWEDLTHAERVVVWNYTNQRQNNDRIKSEFLILEEMWAHDVAEILQILKKIHIKKFLIRERSTECFNIIIELLKAGCKISASGYMLTSARGTKSEPVDALLIELKEEE